MSPPPPPSAPADVGSSISPEVRQGAIAAILGLLGMSTRVMMMNEKVGWGWVAKRLFAASAVAWASGTFLEGYITNQQIRYAVTGVCGYCAPEILQAVEDWVRAKLRAKVNEAERAAGIPLGGKRTNAKRTNKPKRGRK
jgi:hypothetical protein